MKKHLNKIGEKSKRLFTKRGDSLKGAMSLVAVSFVGILIFNFLGNVGTPHRAELSFTEYSLGDKSRGSVVPASCNAAPPDTHGGAYTCSCPTGQHIISSSETGVTCDWNVITLTCDYGSLSWKYNEPAKTCVQCPKIKTASVTTCVTDTSGKFGDVPFCTTSDPVYYTASSRNLCPNTPPSLFVR